MSHGLEEAIETPFRPYRKGVQSKVCLCVVCPVRGPGYARCMPFVGRLTGRRGRASRKVDDGRVAWPPVSYVARRKPAPDLGEKIAGYTKWVKLGYVRWADRNTANRIGGKRLG